MITTGHWPRLAAVTGCDPCRLMSPWRNRGNLGEARSARRASQGEEREKPERTVLIRSRGLFGDGGIARETARCPGAHAAAQMNPNGQGTAFAQRGREYLCSVVWERGLFLSFVSLWLCGGGVLVDLAAPAGACRGGVSPWEEAVGAAIFTRAHGGVGSLRARMWPGRGKDCLWPVSAGAGLSGPAGPPCTPLRGSAEVCRRGCGG